MSNISFGSQNVVLRDLDEVDEIDVQNKKRFQTKTCPRCGELVFADMDTCYGCLYDFSKDSSAHLGISDKEEEKTSPEDTLVNVEEETRDKNPSDLDCTIVSDSPKSYLWVRTNDMDATLPIPACGLRVGRDCKNNIVLHSPAVSRQHLLVMPSVTGILVDDLGATNPALYQGRPISKETLVPFGEKVVLCGACLVAKQIKNI